MAVTIPPLRRLGQKTALREVLATSAVITLLLAPQVYAFVCMTALSFVIVIGAIPKLAQRCSAFDLTVILFTGVVLTGLIGFEESAPLGVALYFVTALSSLFVIFSYRIFREKDFETLIKSFLILMGIEAGMIYLLFFTRGMPRPGDWAYLLFTNAHISGILLLIALQYVVTTTLVKRRWGRIPLVLFYLGAAILTSTKQAMLSFPIALAVLALFLIKRHRFVVVAVSLLLAYPAALEVRKNFGGRSRVPKLEGYYRTLQAFQERPEKLLLGFGAGNYGSRAAVARSDPIDVAKPTAKGMPTSLVGTPSPLKRYLADLYTPDYYDHLRRVGVTGTYYTPFSTWNAIWGELGLLGLTCFAAILVAIFRRAVHLIAVRRLEPAVALTTAVSAGGFCLMFGYENWLEYPQVMVIFWLFAAYTLKLHRRPVQKKTRSVLIPS